MLSVLASEAIVHQTELPFPAIFFGVIAMGLFAALAGITWSYRDVANRHEHKVSGKGHH